MFSEMKTIEQINPSTRSIPSDSLFNTTGLRVGPDFRERDIDDDDFDTVIRFNSGPPK